MKVKKISVFKGLQENIDFADLSEEYADSMSNLDVDEPYGQLTFRDGYLKKYSDSFTNILSAFEYKFPTTDDVVLLINDGGTLELYNDGVKGTNLTLPTGSTLESGFKNQMFGYKDSILITTGNGATNHMLWYGYTQRLAANNDGLFSNDVVDSGTYRLLRAQIIPQYGMFNNIHNSVYIGGYYYFSFGDFNYQSDLKNYPSKYIEKRDTQFRLVEKFQIDNIITTQISDNARISLATDGTYLYAAAEDDLFIIDPATLGTTVKTSLSSNNINSIGVDADHIYAIGSDFIYRRDVNDLTAVDNIAVADDGLCIAVPQSGSYFYTLIRSGNDYVLQQRLKSDLSVNDSETLGTTRVAYIVLDELETEIYAVSKETYVYGINNLYTIPVATMTSSSASVDIVNFIRIEGNTLRGIKPAGLFNLNTNELIYPDIVNIRAVGVGNTGSFVTGVYFYKYSIVDINDQEYTLSDPVAIFQFQDTYYLNNLWISINKDIITSGDAYRIKAINIYRAYSSKKDTDIPDTDYRLIKSLSINDPQWADSDYHRGTGLDYYLYKFFDETTEENMNSVTYFENSGISDETKPRYVNPKFMTWFDNQLHVTNFYYDGKTYKSQIIRSPINQPANIAFYDFYDFGSDGYEIKGITNAFGRTVVFKQFKLGVFYNGTLEHEDDYGISSERGYTKVGDDIFFANPKGIFYLRGHEKLRISEPIEVSWAGLSDYTDNVLFVFEDRDRLIISVPGEYSFVYNLRYKTWVKYSSAFTFKSFFKNSSSEYIGYGDPLAGGSEYFWKISSGIDGRETNGTGGTSITIAYNSGLLRMEPTTGYNVTLQQVDYRSLFTPNITTPITLAIYRYHGTGRTSVRTGFLSPPSGSYITTKTSYLDGAWGESFSWHLAGIASTFKFSEICFVYDDLGFIEQ